MLYFVLISFIIICDNAEGYGFYEGFKSRGMDRVDFYGYCPGVILEHSTSIYFMRSSFVFDPTIPIHVIAKERWFNNWNNVAQNFKNMEQYSKMGGRSKIKKYVSKIMMKKN